MRGERIVFGRTFGRRWFDGFLWGMVAAEFGVLAWDFWSQGLLGYYGGNAMWAIFDLVIFGVAWVSTWEDGGGLSLA